ncbi:hypothetical protein MN608_03312 [Microdochium nivale]|nr:hypothetical protein MN608_03312 [Microdochium nivale]
MVPLLDPFKKIPRVNPFGLLSFDIALFMTMIPVLVVYTTKRASGEWRVPAPELEEHNRRTYVVLVCMFAVRTCLMLWGSVRVCFWPGNRKPVGVAARASSGTSVEMRPRAKQHSTHGGTVQGLVGSGALNSPSSIFQ